jgi:NAD(P)-dependent dehydrogenase (short-subunit alcohol dehydrogenase family)
LKKELIVNLIGKVAIVTGGTRGIGWAIAERLTAAGLHVAIGARSVGDLREKEALLNRRGPVRAIGVECDVRRSKDCARLVDKTVAAFGRLDVLINNAGIGAFATVADMPVERWDEIIGTNLSSLFYCCHAAIPHLRVTGDSWIINIGSLAGKNAFPGGAAYNASKFGLIGFSEALMQEVRWDGIRVSYIMPGSVATDFSGTSSGEQSDSWKVQPEDVAQIVSDLLAFPGRTLPSRIEVRPSQPPRK